MNHPLKFFAAGISFKKTDIEFRSKFAMTPSQCTSVYSEKGLDCFQHFFILSTCNRTEIYGFAPCEYVLLSLLQRYTRASSHEVNKYAYVKEGNRAVRHFLSVASGLDSQIPGDYEIISQIKSAFQLAKEHRRTNGYLERLFNFAMQASKEVKVSTTFSTGSVSVIYAAAQKISREKKIHKVVVVGAGSTGQQAVGYLKKLRSDINITLVNRDAEKLKPIVSMFNVQGATLEKLREELKDTDAMIVTTNAKQPLVKKEHLVGSGTKFIFDLSVPPNVAEDVCKMDQIKSYNVDSISMLTDATIQGRLAEIPKVKAIVTNYENKFSQWSARHHYFSVASQASVGGTLLSRKELKGLFDQWHKSLKDHPDVVHDSTIAGDAILLALKSAYPSAQLSGSVYDPTPLASCHREACVVTSPCSCHKGEAEAGKK